MALHGPYDLRDPVRKDTIRIGIIGTGNMVNLAQRWIERTHGEVRAQRLKRVKGRLEIVAMDPLVYPSFPGVEDVFDVDVVVRPELIETLTQRELAEIQSIGVFEPRVTRLVEILIARLRVLKERSKPDVVFVALPTDIRQKCTKPTKHRSRADLPDSPADLLKRALAKDEARGQSNMFGAEEVLGPEAAHATPEDEHSILHHGLKARAMAVDIPTQLVWEETLAGAPTVEDDATRAWNLWTGVYYKAGNIPWRVEGLERGTCFVGISFYKDRENGALRTCMAQAFSGVGDGIVLRSDPFKWEELGSPHLPDELAHDLMKRVLEAYEEHLRTSPSRVVVHKWQRYHADERRGMERAISAVAPGYDLVAFNKRGIRFYRTGEEAPLRGTVVHLSETNALLFTRGYVPFLGTYNGMRVPQPIEIVEHFGSSSMIRVCEEILALTKLDWNSAMFAGKEPITTAFATDVGHILAELPEGGPTQTSYRFCM